MKTPVRRPNPNRVKGNYNYSVSELALCLQVHKNSIRLWQRRGLKPIDRRRPALFYGKDVKQFLKLARKAAKCPCPPGHFYCFCCRVPRAAALAMVDFIRLGMGTGNLCALCEVCGTMMYRRVKEADISKVMPGCTVQYREG